MGFFASLTGIAKKGKHYFKSGLRHAKRANEWLQRHIGSLFSFIDNALDTAHNFPILSDIAEKIEEHENYQAFRSFGSNVQSILAQSGGVIDNISQAVNPSRGGGPAIPNPLVPQAPPLPPSLGGPPVVVGGGGASAF